MNKSIIIFVTAAILSVLVIIFACFFLSQHVGYAVLTEETISGDVSATEKLSVGFRSDSSNNLHWVCTYDYDENKTDTLFQRGDMLISEEVKTDDIRFTGESTVPFTVRLENSGLTNFQDEKVHGFYDEIQNSVNESGIEQQGKINLSEYLDYYPISYRFQFGSKFFSSDAALTGLKIYEENGTVTEDKNPYEADINLYNAFNDFFQIPIIENEYQEYRITKIDNYDKKTALGYETEIIKPDGENEDYYEFQPIIVLQEENILDGKAWDHPDLTEGLTYIVGGDNSKTSVGKKASEYDLKNRVLFIVNNRTSKGLPVDISHIKDGYGIYELPIELRATATVKQTKRSKTVPHPNPIVDELKLVFPLNEAAEYVDMSMSKDHRYLAVFSIMDNNYFVEIIDADTWISSGIAELFPASDTLTHIWGDDGSLAVTNNRDSVCFFEAESAEAKEFETVPYNMIYRGKISTDFVNTFFMSSLDNGKNNGRGLAVAAKDGKVALVQNPLVEGAENSVRNAALECAVIDNTGLIYQGILKNNITDIEYNSNEQPEINKHTILPVPTENRVKWN